MKPIFFLVYPLLATSIPFIGPPKAPTPFRLEHRSTGIDWNTPRPDSFLKKRSGLHSVEFFTNPPATHRRSPQPMGMSPVSPLQPLEERATAGQWMDMEAMEPGSGAPAVTSWGGQRQDVFYMGRNTRSCYYKYMAPGQSPPWSPWVNLGGSMDSSPSCCSRRPNYMHVYCKGTDGQCWHRPYNGGSWGGWQGMGGNCKGYPSSCSWGPRHSAVYVSSNDNQCWGRKYDENTGWGSWENMGGSLNGPPKAVTWGEGNTGVVVRGQDGQAWVRMMNNGNTWGNWQGLGGSLDAEPTASAMNGRMDVFVTGTDGAVWTRTMMNSTGTWGNWMNMGGDVKPGTPPDVVAWSSGGSMQMEVYYTGPSSQVYRKKYQNGQWSTSWENMGGSVASKPNVVGWDSGKVDVYGMGGDGGTKRCY